MGFKALETIFCLMVMASFRWGSLLLLAILGLIPHTNASMHHQKPSFGAAVLMIRRDFLTPNLKGEFGG